MLQKLIDQISKLLSLLMVLSLALMVVLVFTNVVLRYAFNSGILVSEELSRFFFVWLTFIGAIVAMRDGTHLGMDNVVSKLSRRGKLVCLALSQGLILLCCGMLFWGTWNQHDINATNMSPVTGLSMIWVFGVGYLTSATIAVHALHKLWRIATGRITDHELIEIRESEAMPHTSTEARP